MFFEHFWCVGQTLRSQKGSAIARTLVLGAWGTASPERACPSRPASPVHPCTCAPVPALRFKYKSHRLPLWSVPLETSCFPWKIESLESMQTAVCGMLCVAALALQGLLSRNFRTPEAVSACPFQWNAPLSLLIWGFE